MNNNIFSHLKSYQNLHFWHTDGEDVDDRIIKMTLAEEVAFFNKGAILKEMQSNGEISIVGAMYDINTGTVNFYE